MVEIYMEKIFDLLVPANKKTPLKIRESKTQVFVQGCVAKACSNYEQIQRVIDQGDSNRSVGATAMNATSSRAHTVVTINYSKITKLGGKEGRLQAMINIVDLAGSEKQGQAQTSGKALDEGNAINKSLTMLGNVIETLADISTGKAKKGTVVPYRDSALTRMLQQALGGNSSTIMICAIRPGDLYFEESNNTLRYADRAKKIQNKPIVNEDPQAKLIRELKEENERLKAQLAAGGGGGAAAVGGGGGDPEAARKLAEAEERMRENEQMMQEMAKSWEQKLAEANAKEAAEEQAKKEEEEARNSGRPQIMNLNEDGMLDRKVFLDLSKVSDAKVGRKQANPEENPSIVLGGIGIQSQHASFLTDGSGTKLVPASQDALGHIYINGVKLNDLNPVTLKPNDRVIFGSSSVFLFRNKDAETGDQEVVDTPENPVTYEFAMKELKKIQDAELEQQREEERKKAEEEAAAKMAELKA